MVFEFFPILHGKYLNYEQYIALTLAIVLVFLGFLLLIFSQLLTLIPKLIKRCCHACFVRKKKSNSTNPIDLELLNYPQRSPDDQEYQGPPNPKKSSNKCLSFIAHSISWLAVLNWSLVFIDLMAFDILSLPLSIFLTAATLLLKHGLDLYRKNPSSSKTQHSRFTRLRQALNIAFQNNPLLFISKLVLITIFSFGMTLLFHGTCWTPFNGGNFGLVVGPYDASCWSSTLTRVIGLHHQCPLGPPCHFFATLPEDTSTGVILNIHTHTSITNVTIFYEEAQDTQFSNNKLGQNSKKTQEFPFDAIESLGKRIVHNVLLDSLKPDTLYWLQVYYNDDVQASTLYRTLPSKEQNRTMIIFQGGDLGTNDISFKMLNISVEDAPDVILIGGDLAYDNNIKYCYFQWDGFLKMFETLNRRVGRMIPFIASLGNHDIGLERLSKRDTSVDQSNSLFFSFMAQNTVKDPSNTSNSIIPAIPDRKSYNYYLIGKFLLLNLDSGYISEFSGTQLEFIRSTVNNHPEYTKVAMYHDPIYPPCGSGSLGREYWGPIFDEYHFPVVFENHVHVFKKTFPLTGGKISPNGTVYLGDGAWGVLPRICTLDNSTGIFEKFDNHFNFFWRIEVNTEVIKYSAIVSNGTVVDKGVIYH